MGGIDALPLQGVKYKSSLQDFYRDKALSLCMPHRVGCLANMRWPSTGTCRTEYCQTLQLTADDVYAYGPHICMRQAQAAKCMHLWSSEVMT